MTTAAVRPRVVYDCMIFLQGAARRASPAGACLDLAEQGIVELYVSAALLGEVNDVLRRPRLRAKFPSLTDQLVSEFLNTVQGFARRIDDVPREFVLARDPKDEPYLNLACAANAKYLVSRDRDLLDLAAGTDEAGLAIRSRFPNLEIVEPVRFLLAIREQMKGA